MDKRDILQKIIDSEGKCDWATPAHCSACPLSKLKLKDNGDPMSCVEAVGAFDLHSIEEVNEIYKNTAARKLADIAIEDIIG